MDPCTSYGTLSSNFVATPRVSSPASRLPTFQSGSLTVRYPFPIDYLKDREIIIHDLAKRPIRIEPLPGSLFNVPVRIDILHRVVRYLRAKWRQGTHKAKTRGEVRGGGRKPRPQKKTGRSRQGSIRSPLWRGGGVNFGPRPRSHAHKLPKNVQLLGMKCALSAKCNEGRLVVVDSLAAIAGTPVRPQVLPAMIKGLCKLPSKGGLVPCKTALLIDCGEFSRDGGQALRAAAGDLEHAEVMSLHDLTVYHVLKYNVLIATREAIACLEDTLSNPPHRNKLPRKRKWWMNEKEVFQKALQEIMEADIHILQTPARQITV
ncbi:hypothetical protein CEUSTIGMA_g12236.t1 [Chlamydomonas eustigma]|uniref:Large ribosomal subunit protein uL4m n=1 Tax=Chlamydomonas eustigma TaxID=1157962 RepID=A0A250XP07_9CHLO|nr:hypothetical protein CEUSTIGMA_g12236.t1 [Chlamydomonas eustigma]|eukprot:GAX84815.1 hypothetical protein CEUSTIGMA_g12236.t1 [Chlamydomonas eustigma]